MFQLSRDEQISLVIGLLIISAIAISFFVIKPQKSVQGVKIELPQSNTPEPPSSNKSAVNFPARIYVHVAGEVARPNVYVVWKGSRVFEAIALAGLTRFSDVDSLNLAEVLNDGSNSGWPIPGRQLS